MKRHLHYEQREGAIVVIDFWICTTESSTNLVQEPRLCPQMCILCCPKGALRLATSEDHESKSRSEAPFNGLGFQSIVRVQCRRPVHASHVDDVLNWSLQIRC